MTSVRAIRRAPGQEREARAALRLAVVGGVEAGGAGEPGGAPRRVVLVVDDDPAIRVLAEQALRGGGFGVLCAADGAAALEAYAEHRPALVLCDVMMPGIDGYAVCRALRSRSDGAHIPVVMFTSLDDPESIDRAFEAGANEFIVKPINWRLLPRRLHHVLEASDARDALRRSEERYALAARGANDGLWDWDLESGTVFYSPRWCAMVGESPGAVGDGSEEWLGRIHPDDRRRVEGEIQACIRGERGCVESEHRVRAGEQYRWMLARGVALHRPDGNAYRMAGSLTDIDAQKEIEGRLRYDAIHDSLTGLANRALFLDRLRHAIERAARRSGFEFAVLFMDLDRFKVVNDSLGHLHGDRLLMEVGNRLGTVLRTSDTLARLGGDEFALLVEDAREAGSLTALAERIQEVLEIPVRVGDQEVVTSASIGIASSRTGYERPEDMLRDADAAMYMAKARGPGGFAMFDSTVHARAMHALRLEADLRVALERGQFALRYQPIVAMADGSVRGLEALLRWHHPERGELSPGEFLDVARDTRLIVPIGRWVLAEACRQLGAWRARWPEARGWFVSVNLCSQEFAQPDLVDVVDRILAESGLPGDRLKIEITETALFDHGERSLEVLERLRERSVRLSIDDFGTGQSTFNFLHRFRFDSLKIDRSFIRDLDAEPRRLEIVRAVVELAHNLGLDVVAEGAESADSEARLRDLSCEYAQGYSIARPMVAEQVGRLIGREAK